MSDHIKQLEDSLEDVTNKVKSYQPLKESQEIKLDQLVTKLKSSHPSVAEAINQMVSEINSGKFDMTLLKKKCENLKQYADKL